MTKEEYKAIMELTDYGWQTKGTPYEFKSCPFLLDGIEPSDLLGDGKCYNYKNCMECWEYVLHNKKWDGTTT